MINERNPRIIANDIRLEDELLLCCARTKINEEIGSRIKILINQKPDWRYLMQSAIYHNVVPLLYSTFGSFSSNYIPKQFLKELEYYHKANAKRNLFLVDKLIKLIDFLEANQIPAIPYKGPAIAVLAYGNISLRQFSDLDILVHPDDYLKTRHLFLENGYYLTADYSWECTLVDNSRCVRVDLHRSITPKQFPVHLDFKLVRQRLKTIPISTGKIMTFCPEDMLIILCIQLAKDGCGSKPPKLQKVCDIAELLKKHPDIDWAKVFKIVKKLGCQKILAISLLVAHRLLSMSLPKYLPKSPTNLSVDFLTTYICNRLIHQETTPNYTESLSMNNLHFKMRECWGDKFYPQYYYLKMRLTPNEKDYEFISIPKSLDILYYFIRPIRLAIGYCQFAWRSLKKQFISR